MPFRGQQLMRPEVNHSITHGLVPAQRKLAHEMRPIAFTLRATQETGAGTVGGR